MLQESCGFVQMNKKREIKSRKGVIKMLEGRIIRIGKRRKN
jgi:hypothetical protein